MVGEEAKRSPGSSDQRKQRRKEGRMDGQEKIWQDGGDRFSQLNWG